jgi:hypothetical protein
MEMGGFTILRVSFRRVECGGGDTTTTRVQYEYEYMYVRIFLDGGACAVVQQAHAS